MIHRAPTGERSTVWAIAFLAALVPAAAHASSTSTPAPRAQAQSRPAQVQQQPQVIRQQPQVIRQQPQVIQQQPQVYRQQPQVYRQQPQVIQQQPQVIQQQQTTRQQPQVIQQQQVQQQQVLRQTQVQQRQGGAGSYGAPVYRSGQTQTQQSMSKGEVLEHRSNPAPAYVERNAGVVHSNERSVERRHEGGTMNRPGLEMEHKVPTEVRVMRHEPEHVSGVVRHMSVGRPVIGLRNGRIRDVRVYRAIRAYHIEHYHTQLVTRYVFHPELYHGYWGDGWYHGYWHNYWVNEPWTWYEGNYGFWVNNGGVNTFVYETSPGVCSYWNGSDWVSWYDPPLSPNPCPY